MKETLRAGSLRCTVAAARTRGSRGLLIRELKDRPSVSSSPLFVRGFLSSSTRLYELHAAQSDLYEYVNDREWVRTWSVVPEPFRTILGNKVLFATYLEALGHTEVMPPLRGVVLGGEALPYEGASRFRRGDVAELVAEAPQSGVVCRPISGQGAKGTKLIKARDAEGGLSAVARQVRGLARGQDLLLTDLVAGHPEVTVLYPEAVNTTRILTVWPRGGSGPVIARPVVQRIGTSESAPFDGWARGGLASEVSLETGTLSAALRRRAGERVQRHSQHPDSGVPLMGRRLPFWEETKAAALRVAGSLPGVRIALWEVVIGPDGPVLIEGNHSPGIQLFQVHQPLLRDPAVCEVYMGAGVLEQYWRAGREWRALQERARSAGAMCDDGHLRNPS